MKLHLLLAVIFSLPVAGQTTLVVPSPTIPTIQAGISLAVNGDTVSVGPGTYSENINFLGKSINVRGQGIGVSVIDGNAMGSVVLFASGEGPASVLEGFSLVNGAVPGNIGGGGVRVVGTCVVPGNPFPTISPTIRECEISSCTAATGGGVCCISWGSISLFDCVIRNNQANGGIPYGSGGGISTVGHSHVYMVRCLVAGNTASAHGGGIAAQSAVLISCTVEKNMALGRRRAVGGRRRGQRSDSQGAERVAWPAEYAVGMLTQPASAATAEIRRVRNAFCRRCFEYSGGTIVDAVLERFEISDSPGCKHGGRCRLQENSARP